MRMLVASSICVSLFLASAPIAAQSGMPSAPVATAAPIAAPSTQNAMLRVGTEVPLRLLEKLTTKGKKLRVGSRFRLETAEPIVIQGVTVIPSGSPAMGEITNVRNKGMWGKSGKFVARLLYLTANGRQVRLSGGFDDKGTAGGIGATAVSAVVFLPAGFFMTGTSATVPMGTMVKGFVDEDVPLSFAAETTTMVVPAAAPMAVDSSPPAPSPPSG